MKRTLLIFSLLCALSIQAQTQDVYMNNNEIQTFLDSMMVHKEQIKGKTMDYIYQTLDIVKFPIRHYSIGETSPWIDSKGISYMESVILYTETLDDMNEGKEYFMVEFYLDIPKTNADIIWKLIPDDPLSEVIRRLKEITMTMIIKDIKYKKWILPLNL